MIPEMHVNVSMDDTCLELTKAFLNENKLFHHPLGSPSVLPVLVVTLSITGPCGPQLAFTGSTEPQQMWKRA
jgi:hypothetical protein